MNELQTNKETLVAFARLIASLIMGMLTLVGWAIDEELLVNIVLTVITFVLIVRELWWKNNNVTKAAQLSQVYQDSLKRGDLEEKDD